MNVYFKNTKSVGGGGIHNTVAPFKYERNNRTNRVKKVKKDNLHMYY